MDALTPFTRAGHDVKDVVESGTDVVRRIYEDAKYEPLAGLKREWDPENVFRMNQNVRPRR